MRPTPMPDLTPELLARHQRWLHALIRRLVGQDQADDVLQEVWGQALQQPLRDQKALPAFLATVARRLAGRQLRTDRRRGTRERAIAETTPTESADTAALVARLEERQQIASAVLELDEPFRTVVLLRYFEDVQPAEIAKRLGVPMATVRTRLHRAHDKLRERFARERGKGWRGQLAALCAPLPSAAPGPALSGLGSARLTAIAALPLLLAIGIWWILDTSPAPSLTAPGQSETAVASAPTGIAVAAPEDQPDALSRTKANASPSSTTARTRRVAGTVLDHNGAPLQGAELHFVRWHDKDAPERLGRSDARGRFAVDAPVDRGQLVAAGFVTTLRSWSLDSGTTQEDNALVIASPKIRVAGRVVDEHGTPQASCKVAVYYNDVPGFPAATAGTQWVSATARDTTDAEGRFSLADVPAFEHGDLRVDMFRAIVPIPTTDTFDLEIALGQGRPIIERDATNKPAVSPPRIATIALRIFDSGRKPIKNASARLERLGSNGSTGTKAADEHGVVRLQAPVRAGKPIALLVTAPGYGPARREVWVAPDVDEVQEAVLLSDSERAIVGTITDRDGKPLHGRIVALADATPLTFGGTLTRYIEAPEPDPFGAHATTAADGSFRIPGVLDRTYRIRVFETATGFAADYGPLSPGEHAAIELPTERTREVLEVHIQDRFGEPIEGVDIALSVVRLHTERSPEQIGRSYSTSFFVDASEGTSNAEGLYRFAAAPGGNLRINASKPRHVPAELDFDPQAGATLTITLLRQVQFRIATKGLDNRMVGLRMFDAADRELEVRPAWRGDILPSAYTFGVHRGKSVVAGVAETVVRAELYDLFSDVVLRRMPVVATRDEVTVLDFPQ